MTLGFIVLAHRGPEQLALLVRRLVHPDTRIYLHVDARSDLAAFRRHLGETAADVTLLPRFPSRWGGVEVVDATLAGLRRAREDGCGYVMLLSGQDFPVWPVERTVAWAAAEGTRSHVSHFPLPDPRWRLDGRVRTECYTYTVRGRRETCIPARFDVPMSFRGRVLNGLLRLRGALKPVRRFPAYVRPFGGSQWWNLSGEAVRFVFDFLERHPDYRAYHEHTLLPDEMFFQSILLGTDFHERHEVVDDALRFMIWEEGSSHPRTLTREDLPAAHAGGRPFARKFDLDQDREAVTLLDAWLRGEGAEAP